MGSVNTIILLGKPASGKGTQGKLLAERRGWKHIASGDYLRSLATREDHIGERVRAELATGALLPSWIVNAYFASSALELAPAEGIVFDGFGRDQLQAQEVHQVLAWQKRPYLAVCVEVHDNLAAERMRSRLSQEERTDSDSEEKIKLRLQLYAENALAVVRFFDSKGAFRWVDGDGSPDEVYEKLVTHL
ncbi:MAG TPA: nucleoside monophosphate kinase [Candidatus Paceibacterota bacterium]|nr:nucleoside monophosphate kinase [Candidatus Paceibacterota bacterium]